MAWTLLSDSSHRISSRRSTSTPHRKGSLMHWNKLLAKVPPETFMYPVLDIGCGRGLVLMKIAERKKGVAFSTSRTPDPAYGVDLFIRGDQSGNAPEATYDNAASLNLTIYLTLHTANFIYLPFKDETMSLATASLSFHNVDKASREMAIVEAARVLKPDGYLIILELAGYIGQYKSVLKSMGWSEIQAEFGGMRVMFGAWPCQVPKARKPGSERS